MQKSQNIMSHVIVYLLHLLGHVGILDDGFAVRHLVSCNMKLGLPDAIQFSNKN
jgi:hypothetical protein